MKDKFKFDWIETGISEIDSQYLKASVNLLELSSENKKYITGAISTFEEILQNLTTIEEKYFALYLRSKVENILKIDNMDIFDDGGIKTVNILEAIKRRDENIYENGSRRTGLSAGCSGRSQGECGLSAAGQSADCRTAAAGKGDEEETSQLDALVRQADGGRSLCGRHAGPNEGRGAHREHP